MKADNQHVISAIEYTQKLDLLVHLLTNLQNCLILKGKQGIGKSTFLKTVLKRKNNKHELHLIKANDKMSFEVIQAELLKIISASYQLDVHHSIADVLAIYAKEGKSLVLLIDDAGCLVSGLVGTLISYASQYPALHLVFALTPSEYDAKQKIEKIESSCQVMILAGLTLKQTELLIYQLVTSGNTAYTKKAIDTDFVQKVYNITQGNPREINQLILSTKKKHRHTLVILMGVILMVALFSIVINYYLWSEPEQSSTKALTIHREVITEPSVPYPVKQHPIKPIQTIKSMVLEQEATVLPSLKKSLLPARERKKSSSVIVSDVLDSKKQKETQGESLPAVEPDGKLEKVKPSIPAAKKMILAESNKFKQHKIPVIDNNYQWILAKKGTDYTLQLMVLSTKEKLLAVQKKYLKLGYKTFYITKNTKKSLIYLLFYGHFTTLTNAKIQAKKLPIELRKAWPRKISVIQKKIQNNILVNIREGEKRK